MTDETQAPAPESAEIELQPEDVTQTETPESTEADAVTADEPKKPDPKIAQEAYRDREMRRLQRQVGQLTQLLEQQNSAAKAPDNKPPKIEDFDDLDSYFDARYEYLNGKQSKPAQQEPQEINEAVQLDQYKKVVFDQAGMQKYPDFTQVVLESDLPFTLEMANALHNMDNGHDIAYQLAKNPAEVYRLSYLDPVQQVMELVKMTVKPAKKTTTAPKPNMPIKGDKTQSNDLDPRDSMDEFMRKRNRRLGRS